MWHEENGRAEEAIHHALASKDFKRAARLIESVAVLMSQGGHFTTILHWLEALPEDVRQELPQLNIWYAWTLYLTGRIEDYERPLEKAEQALRARGDEAVAGGREAPSRDQVPSRGDHIPNLGYLTKSQRGSTFVRFTCRVV